MMKGNSLECYLECFREKPSDKKPISEKLSDKKPSEAKQCVDVLSDKKPIEAVQHYYVLSEEKQAKLDEDMRRMRRLNKYFDDNTERELVAVYEYRAKCEEQKRLEEQKHLDEQKRLEEQKRFEEQKQLDEQLVREHKEPLE